MELTEHIVGTATEAPPAKPAGASAVWTIYCHIHVESGRRYVGQTKKTWRQRWDQHVSQAKHVKTSTNHWYNAIRKYGKDAFSHEIFEKCDSLEAANAAEQEWIDHFGTRDPEKGFNLTRGGTHTPHSVKNPWDRPEYREKHTEINREVLRRPEVRSIMAKKSKDRFLNPEYVEKHARISREVHARPDVLSKMSTAFTGRKHTAEARAKMSAWSSKKTVDEQTRKKISDSENKFVMKNGVLISKTCKTHGVMTAEMCYVGTYIRKNGERRFRAVCLLCKRISGKKATQKRTVA